MFRELLKKNRSYRTFDESVRIDRDTLLSLVELTRLTPATANVQPVKYFLSCDDETNAVIFPLIRWAGSLPQLKLPPEGKKPTAYIVVCLDEQLSKGNAMFLKDVGIVSQTIMLGAAERGLGGCMFGSGNPDRIREALGLPGHITPSLVLALGKPDETVVLEDIPADGKHLYYRDEHNVHHVPKRTMAEILL